jgi:hypothetical protein
MATIERDDDDERADEDADDREDHAVILARRRMLIATALGGVAVGVEGCDWIEQKLGAAPRVCLDMAPAQACLQTVAPTACLNVAARPCLEVMVPEAPASDAGTVSAAPCLSTSPQPPPQPLPRPRVCLSRTAPRPPAPPHPRPMVCLSEELVQKRADDDEDDG